MKRILSMILALCMVLGLMAGMAVTAFAEEEAEIIAITGVTAPAAGGAVTTDGITGAPQGFTLTAQWEVYDYAGEDMDDYTEATFADNSVYRLRIWLTAEEGVFLSRDQEYDLTVNGEAASDWWFSDSNESGFIAISAEQLFYVGDITIIDSVTIEALPAEEVGTSTDLSGIALPDGAPYKLSSDTQWCRNDGEPVGSTLEADLQYELWTYIVPEVGYWIVPDAEVIAPREHDYFYVGTDGSLNADFYYDLRPIVKRVELSLDTDLAYGDPTADAAVTVPEGSNYTVSASWYPDSETLGYGEYRLLLTVLPTEGYSFRDDLTVTVNGQRAYEAENWYIRNYDESQLEIEAWFEIAPENGFVQDIRLSGAPGNITAGEAIAAPTVEVERGEVTVSKTEWVDADYAPVSGKFQDGKEYYLAISLTPAEGYALRSGYYAQVETDEGYVHPYQEANPDGTAVVYIRYSLMPSVDTIEITVTEPAVGAAPAEPKVPEGAKYTIADYYWYEYTEGSDVTVFEDGKGYYLEMNVVPAEGYEFGEGTKLTINGKEPHSWGVGNLDASATGKYSFMTQIDRVDITMPEPTLGGVANTEGIKVPEDAKYSLDLDGCEWSSYATEFNGTFEKDQYRLWMYLDANEGCEFSDDVECYVNGKLWDDFYTYDRGTRVEVLYEVSFRDVLTKIELPALPTVAVGDEPTAPELEAPEGANYTISAYWAKSTGGLSLEDVTGPFQNGTFYYLVLQATPNAGYAFSEDAVITIGGKEFNGIQMVSDDYAFVAKMYTFGLTVIDKVELTVDAPENGKVPGEITVPADGGYEIGELAWAAGKDADMDEAKTMKKSDTFAYGNYYWVSGSIQTKEGYVLAEDVVITVNGQVVDMSIAEEMFGFVPVMGDTAVVFYSFGQLTEPVQEPTPPADIPDTGDTAPVVLLAVVAVMSMAALVVIGKKKFA